MRTITVRLNEEEMRIYEGYAKLSNMPLSTLFKKSLEEKMETELDMQAIREYESKDSSDTYTHKDVKKLLGL